MNLTMTGFCTFPLSPTGHWPWDNLRFKWTLLWPVSALSFSPTDRWPQDSPRPAHQQAPVWNQFWIKMKKAAPGWQGRLGNQRPFQRMVMGRRLTFWRTKKIPRLISVMSMSDFSNKRPTEEFPGKPKASPATGCHENGWGHAPWVRWLCIAVWHPSSGSHPHVLSVLHPQVQSVVRHVHSQLAPTSTVRPA